MFTCRFWWSCVRNLDVATNTSNNNNSESIKKIKANRFITKATFWCIEMSAHTLLYLILLVIKQKLPIDALNTYIFSSQPCENMFRIARALSGPYSSVTNFSVKSFVKRCEKISIINSIKSQGIQIDNCRLQFPQHHKTDRRAYDYSTKPIDQLKLTEGDIEKIIENAFESAKQYASLVNMTKVLTEKKIYSLSDLSRFIKISLNKSSSRVVDYMDDTDSEDDDDEGEFSDEEDQMTPDMTDEEEEEEEDDEDNVLTKDLSVVERKNFEGCRIYDKINLKQAHKFFRIHIGTSTKYVHKQTACWLLTKGKSRLSTDRLIRVRGSRK